MFRILDVVLHKGQEFAPVEDCVPERPTDGLLRIICGIESDVLKDLRVNQPIAFAESFPLRFFRLKQPKDVGCHHELGPHRQKKTLGCSPP